MILQKHRCQSKLGTRVSTAPEPCDDRATPSSPHAEHVAAILQLIAIELKYRLICISNRTVAVHSGAISKRRCQLAVVAEAPHQSKFEWTCTYITRTRGHPLPRICRQSLNLKRNVACVCCSDPSSQTPIHSSCYHPQVCCSTTSSLVSSVSHVNLDQG
jgi:hypothetical protein